MRDEIAAIFEVYIPKGQWRVLLDELDREGKPTRKQTNSILLSFGQHIEALEEQLAQLQQQSVFPFKDTDSQQTTEVKEESFVTSQNIIEQLKEEEPKGGAYYLGWLSWDILITQIKKEYKKLNPELFYGKETDPQTGHEKTCIFANVLGTTPIFRA